MNKVKWSFSLVLVIFLVGILNTAVYAASDMYHLKPVQNGLGLDVSFTGDLNKDVEGQEFDLILKDGLTSKSYGPKGINNLNEGIFNIPSSDVTIGKLYTVELYYTEDTNHTQVLSVSSVLVKIDSHNTSMYQAPNTHLDVNGTGLINSNETGSNNPSKKKQGQNIHGFYQNNTNSCASCHQTHTGADDSLLFKEGVYSTCSACHDGTTGAFNAFTNIDSQTPNSLAGTFDVLKAGHNGSLHQADGSLNVSAAPGGNNTDNPIWGAAFDCGSCHAPHGSGSTVENNLNMDPLGWGGIAYDPSTKDGKNGKLFKNAEIIDLTVANHTLPSTIDGHQPYILVREAVSATDVVNDKTKYSSLYNRAGVKEGDLILQTYRWTGSKYDRDFSLWLRSNDHVSAPFEQSNTLFKNANGDNITSSLKVVWRDGFAFGPAVANVSTAQFSLGIDVETTEDIASLFDSNNQNYVYDSGVEMTKYCAACHSDYFVGPGTTGTGVLTAYHRHKEVSDKFTCVRCHFSHGSEAQIMKDVNDHSYYDLTAQGGTYAGNSDGAINYLLDRSQSSSLKRYTGLASCYQCHDDNDQF